MKTFLSILLALVAPLIFFSGCERPLSVDAAANTADAKAIPPEERDPDRLWCNEHAVYEDECYICHPELAPKEQDTSSDIASEDRDPTRLWCNEHSLYEDECLICHPELAEKAEDEHADHDDHAGHGAHEEREGVLWCGEHDLAEDQCGVCQPQLMDSLDVGSGMKLRVSDPSVLQTAGLSTVRTAAADASTAQEILGRVTYNRNHLALVTPLVGGVVTEVSADVGDEVEAGAILAKVRAHGITESATAYLKAIADADYKHKVYLREKDLFDREISARQDFEAAQADWEASRSEVTHGRQHLLNLGVSESEVDALTHGGAASGDLYVRAPFAGTLVNREAVVGTAVEPGDALFQVADLSEMWLTLSVPESRLSAVKKGMPLTVRVDAYPGVLFEGVLSWIGSSVDPDTRMIEARAALPNPQGLLKDGMFARAQLGGAAQSAGITVPEDAVQLLDGRAIVFARLEENLFEARLVALGAAQDERVAITGGLVPGEEVMTGATYVLKSELLKSRLGAGCADH